MSTCSWKSIFCCAKTDNDSEADYDVLLKPEEPQGQVYRARLRLQKDQQDYQDITLIIADNKSTAKWDYRAKLPQDESHTDATKKSGGKSGLQMDRQDKTQAEMKTSAHDKDNSSQHVDAANQQAQAEILNTIPPPSSYCSVSISGMTIQYNLSDRIKNLFRDEHRNPTVDLVRLLTSTSETEVLAVDSCGRVFFKHYEPADDGNETSSIFFRVQFFSLLNPDRLVVMWIAYDSRLPIAVCNQDSSDIQKLFAIHPDDFPSPPSDSDLCNLTNTDESLCFCWLPTILENPTRYSKYFFYQYGIDSLAIYPEINDTSPATNGTSQGTNDTPPETNDTSSDTNDTRMRICKDTNSSHAKIGVSNQQFLVTTVSTNVVIN